MTPERGRMSTADTALPYIDEHARPHALRAESRAAFPGARGAVYRMLLMGTGGHVLVTRRMLAAVKRSAERQ